MTEPKFGPLGRDVFNRTYSREKEDGTRETWGEVVDRVVEGSFGFLKDWDYESPRNMDMGQEKLFLRERIGDMRLLPAGRHLWATGIDDDSQFIDNCFMVGHYNPDDIADHFVFTFLRLMEGGGVGTNYSNSFVDRLPPLLGVPELVLICDPVHKDWDRDFNGDSLSKHCGNYEHWYSRNPIHVEDSREGWADALDLLMREFTVPTPKRLVFNLTSVRPYGAKIRKFGGTASGPYPLAKMLRDVHARMAEAQGRRGRLTSLDCNALDHYIAVSVVSGNVRRSARLGCKHWRDDDIADFISCKDGATALWTANISVALDSGGRRRLTDESVGEKGLLDSIVSRMRSHGEPGIANLDLARHGRLGDSNSYVAECVPVVSCNPCAEIYGDDLCCLGHVNMAAHKSVDDMLLSARLMARFLIRATFSPKPDWRLDERVFHNRRIGVGVTGYHNWLVKNGIKYSESHRSEWVRSVLRQLYETVRDEARSYAYSLRIPEPVKCTAVAPCGTVSLLAGVAQGIHPVYALTFLRRTVYSMADANQAGIVAAAEKLGHRVEPSLYTPNTMVVESLCQDSIVEDAANPGVLEDAHSIGIRDMMEVCAMFQEEFADNAVSFTANFDADRVTEDQLARIVLDFMGRVKGMTVMPFVHDRPQAPYKRLSMDEYEALKGKMRPMLGNSETECAGGACPVK